MGLSSKEEASAKPSSEKLARCRAGARKFTYLAKSYTGQPYPTMASIVIRDSEFCGVSTLNVEFTVEFVA